MNESRRRLLGVLVAAGTCGVGWRVGDFRPEPVDAEGPMMPLGDFPRNRSSARVVGEAYLRHHPAEADRGMLERAVFSPDDPHARRLRPEEPLATLTARVRDDFERGRVVTVDGWLLSRTEARLCGLIALR